MIRLATFMVLFLNSQGIAFAASSDPILTTPPKKAVNVIKNENKQAIILPKQSNSKSETPPIKNAKKPRKGYNDTEKSVTCIKTKKCDE